jgi:hypothetical protein
MFHSAIKITKEAIAAKGLKLGQFSRRTIEMLAGRYVELHCEELIAEVIERVRTERGLAELALSEAKRRGRYWPKPVKPERPPKMVYPIECLALADSFDRDPFTTELLT